MQQENHTTFHHAQASDLERSQQPYFENAHMQSQNIIQTLKKRVMQGRVAFDQDKYIIQKKGMINTYLPQFDTECVQKIVYQSKTYGIPVKYAGRPWIDIPPNMKVFVIISPVLLEYESNFDFLKATNPAAVKEGQNLTGQISSQLEIEMHRKHHSTILQSDAHIAQNLKLLSKSKRLRALLKPVSVQQQQQRQLTLTEMYESNSIENDSKLQDYDKLSDLFRVLLSNSQRIYPLDLESYLNFITRLKCCSHIYHINMDMSGGVKYCQEKSVHSGKNVFGITKRAKGKDQRLTFENPPKNIEQQPLFSSRLYEQGSLRSRQLVPHHQTQRQPPAVIDASALTDDQKAQRYARMVADVNDMHISLPQTYYEFSSFESDVDHKEYINLPKFYANSPMLAETVVYTRSDIEKLESRPDLFENFHKEAKRDMDKMHQQICDEDIEEAKEIDELTFIGEISLESQVQFHDQAFLYCKVCKAEIERQNYFKHLQCADHLQLYMEEPCEYANTYVIKEIDSIFEEMNADVMQQMKMQLEVDCIKDEQSSQMQQYVESDDDICLSFENQLEEQDFVEPSKESDEQIVIPAVTHFVIEENKEQEISELESIEQKYLKTINKGSQDSQIMKRRGVPDNTNLDGTTKGCSPPDLQMQSTMQAFLKENNSSQNRQKAQQPSQEKPASSSWVQESHSMPCSIVSRMSLEKPMITRASARLQQKNRFFQMHYRNVVDTSQESSKKIMVSKETIPRRSQRIQQKKRDKKYNEKKQLQVLVNIEPKVYEPSTPKGRTRQSNCSKISNIQKSQSSVSSFAKKSKIKTPKSPQDNVTYFLRETRSKSIERKIEAKLIRKQTGQLKTQRPKRKPQSKPIVQRPSRTAAKKDKQIVKQKTIQKHTRCRKI